MSVLDGESTPAPSPGVRAESCDGGAVLYDEANARLHVLDPFAALLWECFDGTSSLDDIAADVAEAFDIDRTETRERVFGLTGELAGRGLLLGVAPSPSEPEESLASA